MMEIGIGTGLDAGGDDGFPWSLVQHSPFPFVPSFIFPFLFFSLFLFDETRLDNETENTTITNMHASFLDPFYTSK